MDCSGQSDETAPHQEFLGLPAPELASEVSYAAQTGISVLISGRRDAAKALARRVHDLRPVRSTFVVFDCGQDEASLLPALAGALGALPCAGHTLFLQDVDRLTRSLQSVVASRLRDHAARTRTGTTAQVIASTSVNLFERMTKGAFDEGLFYLLNTIHIVL